MYEKHYIRNLASCSCENDKYVGNIIDNSLIMCDEIIDTTKTIPTNSNKKINICNTKKLQYFYCFLINYYSVIESW